MLILIPSRFCKQCKTVILETTDCQIGRLLEVMLMLKAVCRGRESRRLWQLTCFGSRLEELRSQTQVSKMSFHSQSQWGSLGEVVFLKLECEVQMQDAWCSLQSNLHMWSFFFFFSKKEHFLNFLNWPIFRFLFEFQRKIRWTLTDSVFLYIVSSSMLLSLAFPSEYH